MGILAVFAYAAVSYVNTYSSSVGPSSLRSFTARGAGEVVAIPDVAQFTFSVISEGGKDIANIQKENTGKVNKIIDFIKSNGVEKKDIKTQSYNVQPRYQYYECGTAPFSAGTVTTTKKCPPRDIIGYTIKQTVLVKARSFNKIGELLAGAVKNGANSVSGLSFTLDNKEKIENQARAKAIKNAKEKAESIAEAAGFRLGRLISVQENVYIPPPFYRSGMEGAKVVNITPPGIEPGSQKVTSSVVLKYEIK